MSQEFIALHPVRHGKTRFKRGAVIPAGTFNSRDEAALRRSGTIGEPKAEIVVREVTKLAPGLAKAELEKFSGPQLAAYAQGRGLTLKSTVKDEVIAEILASYEPASEEPASEPTPETEK